PSGRPVWGWERGPGRERGRTWVRQYTRSVWGRPWSPRKRGQFTDRAEPRVHSRPSRESRLKRRPRSRGSRRGSALPLKRRQFTDRAEPRVHSRPYRGVVEEVAARGVRLKPRHGPAAEAASVH